jgi:uncharacterized membrane protein
MPQTAQPTRRISVPGNRGIKIECSVTIHRPVEEVFAFWADFRNLPKFFVNLESVTILPEGTTRWKAYDPMHNLWEWDAETINQHPNELIAWRSLPGTRVPNAGSVRFQPVEHGAGTRVDLKLEYDPPTGMLAPVFLAMMLLPDPEKEIQQSLHRLKALMESA